MMAALILVASLVALLQFFVSYCRSLIAASMKHPLSPEVQDVTGITGVAAGEDYARVVQLLQLCPDRPEDRGGMKAVGAYFGLLGLLRSTVARLVPAWAAWTDSERAQCTYFAAVTLDRRIAFSRDLFAQQMDT
jgi:hypothetical protein